MGLLPVVHVDFNRGSEVIASKSRIQEDVKEGDHVLVIQEDEGTLGRIINIENGLVYMDWWQGEDLVEWCTFSG